MASKREIVRWMKDEVLVDHFLADNGEVEMTTLAEAACGEFDAYGPAPHYDIPEEYFECAYEVATWLAEGGSDG